MGEMDDGRGRWTMSCHQSPDDRHGPSQRSTRPPAHAAAIGRDADRAPLFDVTRAGIGRSKRRRTLDLARLRRRLGEARRRAPIKTRRVGISKHARRIEFRHRKGAGTICVDERRRADAVAAHQRAQPREQRRKLVGRQRARKQPELQHTSFRDLDPTVTRSIAAGGGFDSRSSSASVRSTRASRIGAGSSTTRSCRSRPPSLRAEANVTSVKVIRRRTAPRSLRSSRSHKGSSRRASTNDNGSRPSMGHSSSSDSSNCSATSAGTSGRISSPRAHRCQRRPV